MVRPTGDPRASIPHDRYYTGDQRRRSGKARSELAHRASSLKADAPAGSSSQAEPANTEFAKAWQDVVGANREGLIWASRGRKGLGQHGCRRAQTGRGEDCSPGQDERDRLDSFGFEFKEQLLVIAGSDPYMERPTMCSSLSSMATRAAGESFVASTYVLCFFHELAATGCGRRKVHDMLPQRARKEDRPEAKEVY